MSWSDTLKELVKTRTDICKECPYLRKSLKQCKLCGCFVIPKAALPRSKCPDNRWPKR